MQSQLNHRAESGKCDTECGMMCDTEDGTKYATSCGTTDAKVTVCMEILMCFRQMKTLQYEMFN